MLRHRLANPGLGCYALALLTDPQGNRYPVELHSTHHKGDQSVSQWVTGFGEYAQLTDADEEAGWSFQKINSDQFRRYSGLTPPPLQHGTQANPWWIERERTPEIRAYVKLCRDLRVPSEGDTEALCELFFGYPSWRYTPENVEWLSGQYEGARWASWSNRSDRGSYLDNLLDYYIEEASSVFTYHAVAGTEEERKSWPRQTDTEAVAHALSVIGVAQLLMELPERIEQERVLIAKEIEPYARLVTADPPRLAMEQTSWL